MSSLFNKDGERLFLTENERKSLLEYAKEDDRRLTHALIAMLLSTGCTLDEAIKLKGKHINQKENYIEFDDVEREGCDEAIKRRVQVSEEFMKFLRRQYCLNQRNSRYKLPPDKNLWDWPHVSTPKKRIREFMQKAGIQGAHANPTGIRLSYIIHMLDHGYPLDVISIWAGYKTAKSFEQFREFWNQEKFFKRTKEVDEYREKLRILKTDFENEQEQRESYWHKIVVLIKVNHALQTVYEIYQKDLDGLCRTFFCGGPPFRRASVVLDKNCDEMLKNLEKMQDQVLRNEEKLPLNLVAELRTVIEENEKLNQKISNLNVDLEDGQETIAYHEKQIDKLLDEKLFELEPKLKEAQATIKTLKAELTAKMEGTDEPENPTIPVPINQVDINVVK